jgi:hypothetical protein
VTELGDMGLKELGNFPPIKPTGDAFGSTIVV